MALKTVEFLRGKSGTVPFTDGTVKNLSERAKTAGVTLSVVLPVVTNPLSISKINRFAAEQNRSADKTGVFSFGGIHPDAENIQDALREVKDLGLKGVKIHPAYQHTMINDIKYKRITEIAQDLGLIVVSHAGLDIGVDGDFCPPAAAAELIDDVRPEKFVLAHMGGWEQWDDVIKFLCGKNVYFDTAFSAANFNYDQSFPREKKKPVLSAKAFTEIVNLHGADKILFGTDSPWGDQREQIDFISALPLKAEQKSAIFYGNAAKLLG